MSKIIEKTFIEAFNEYIFNNGYDAINSKRIY